MSKRDLWSDRPSLGLYFTMMWRTTMLLKCMSTTIFMCCKLRCVIDGGRGDDDIARIINISVLAGGFYPFVTTLDGKSYFWLWWWHRLLSDACARSRCGWSHPHRRQRCCNCAKFKRCPLRIYFSLGRITGMNEHSNLATMLIFSTILIFIVIYAWVASSYFSLSVRIVASTLWNAIFQNQKRWVWWIRIGI